MKLRELVALDVACSVVGLMVAGGLMLRSSVESIDEACSSEWLSSYRRFVKSCIASQKSCGCCRWLWKWS